MKQFSSQVSFFGCIFCIAVCLLLQIQSLSQAFLKSSPSGNTQNVLMASSQLRRPSLQPRMKGYCLAMLPSSLRLAHCLLCCRSRHCFGKWDLIVLLGAKHGEERVLGSWRERQERQIVVAFVLTAFLTVYQTRYRT